MDVKEILNFIEDKDIVENEDWYFHATSCDLDVIKSILDEGIKAAYLRNKKGNHFNGKYYISLYKNTKEAEGLKLWLSKHPKFIIKGISPFYADRDEYNFRRIFINTRLPLRTSEWDGEFHQYLQINPSKIVALEYSLSHLLTSLDDSGIKNKLFFLRDMVLSLEQVHSDLPIYDLSSHKEINIEKVLSLTL